MPVTTLNSVDGPFAGDGLTDEFLYTFDVPEAIADSEIEVVVRDSNGIEHVQVITTHYTHDWSLKKITMVSAPLTGEYLSIRCATPATQGVTLSASSGWTPAADQLRIDKVTRAVRNIVGQLGRVSLGPLVRANPPERKLVYERILPATPGISVIEIPLASGYERFQLEVDDLRAVSGDSIAFQFSDDNGSSYITGADYQYHLVTYSADGSDAVLKGVTNFIRLTSSASMIGTAYGYSGRLDIHRPVPASPISVAYVEGSGVYLDASSDVYRANSYGRVLATGAAVTTVRLVTLATNNFAHGAFRLWAWPAA